MFSFELFCRWEKVVKKKEACVDEGFTGTRRGWWEGVEEFYSRSDGIKVILRQPWNMMLG